MRPILPNADLYHEPHNPILFITKSKHTMNEKHSSTADHEYDEEGVLQANHDFAVVQPNDVFGNESGHAIKYKTLSWPMVAVLMITEIVSNGMLSLPQSGGAVGVSILATAQCLLDLHADSAQQLIPNVILIVVRIRF